MKSLFSIFSRKDVCLPLTNIQGIHVEKYRFFRDFLNHNNTALKINAELEQTYYSGKPFTIPSIQVKYQGLLKAVSGVISSLEAISGKALPLLNQAQDTIDRAVLGELKTVYTYETTEIVLPFERIAAEMKKMVGAKAGHLAFIKNSLGLPVPDGFAVTVYAFDRFMQDNDLLNPVEEALLGFSPDFPSEMENISKKVQSMIMSAKVPEDISKAILNAYQALEEKYRKGVHIAMRSSAIGEDTEATFAGQYRTVLNITGDDIIHAYKTVIASKYSARAILYRMHYGLDDKETPMCVAGVVMLDPVASGVVYTNDSSSEDPHIVKISSIWGLGEHLVDGSASPDIFLVDRANKTIAEREINRKLYRLINLDTGGTQLVEVPEIDRDRPSLDDDMIIKLAGYGLILEDAFGGPQDIEWALDKKGSLFILQSRPLGVLEKIPEDEKHPDLSGYHVLLSSGGNASPGISTGKVFVLKEGGNEQDIPENSILVAKTASPDYAKLIGKVKGIITDIGSVTSHLSSVAREFGVPVIVDTKNATAVLSNGEEITMSATSTTVYKGIVKELEGELKPIKRLVFESPVHRRMRRILDMISPLNLTDPDAPSFSPDGCKTFHDIIRFTHEMAVKEMFGLTEETQEVRSIKLKASIPLDLHLIDLGGGLQEGLTTCHVVTPEHIKSIPMKAIWRGFTHPGITWAGAIGVDMKKVFTLFAASATAEQPGGTSYAILSGEYMNLSAKFGYHFATIDTLCSENSNQNYISLQFSGGAGNYYGKSLRISFLGSVLKKLGFQVSLKGDLLEAFLIGYDMPAMEERLDLLGRLLASSRLLDMALSNQHDIELFIESFFRGDYDFLSPKRDDLPKDFYVHGGFWKRSIEEGRVYCLQDGSKSGYSVSSGVAGMVGKFLGASLQDFLDNIEAYYYFPLAIAKNSDTGDGIISVRVKPVGGHIDRAGGIAFGIWNASNYFVLRINALEDNIILFEYVNNKRMERINVKKGIESNKWYQLLVEVRDRAIKGYLDGEMLVEYTAEKPVRGFVGLWTKADSVTYFDRLAIKEKIIDF